MLTVVIVSRGTSVIAVTPFAVARMGRPIVWDA